MAFYFTFGLLKGVFLAIFRIFLTTESILIMLTALDAERKEKKDCEKRIEVSFKVENIKRLKILGFLTSPYIKGIKRFRFCSPQIKVLLMSKY